MRKLICCFLVVLVFSSIFASAALLADECPACTSGTLRFDTEDEDARWVTEGYTDCYFGHPTCNDRIESKGVRRYYACDNRNCGFVEVHESTKERGYCPAEGVYY